jgi:Heparinase II/III-like protein/Heparinase II/III N-terminus
VTPSQATQRSRIAPRPVFCVTASAHRDRDIAEDVCRGRFTHAGVTLDLGRHPDWLGEVLPADPEWRIEWNKFYWGLDLAHAFAEVREARFLETWERLVESWIDQVPIGSDETDVTARRIQNWIYAWTMFLPATDPPGLSDGLEERLLASLADQADYVRRNLTAETWRNHRTLELYALFLAAIAFPQLDPGGDLLGFSVSELGHNLEEGFHRDGVFLEGSTHYHAIVLQSMLGARENARRFGIDLPSGFDACLERACEFMMHFHRPDGMIPALSDADTGSYLELLELASESFGRRDFAFVATRGGKGAPPPHRHVSFPAGGYFIQRSGWGLGTTPFEEERYLIFDCGPVGMGGHGHYDALNVEISAGGRALVVDPGRFTYSEEAPNLRRWFKGTAAHNTVTVDGLDQTPYRRGKPKGPTADGRLLGRWSAPGLDAIWGEVTSPCYEVVHRRRVLFVAESYWIFEDRLIGNGNHRFQLRWHLGPDAWGSTETIEGGRLTQVRSPGLRLAIVPGEASTIEEGWVAPRYGSKVPGPIVTTTVEGVTETSFYALVAPSVDREIANEIDLGVVGDGATTVVEITGVAPAGAKDVVGWSESRAPIRLGDVEFEATAAWVRTAPSGERLELRTCEADG